MKQTSDVTVRVKVFVLILLVAVVALALAYAIREKNMRDLAVRTSRIYTQSPPSDGTTEPVAPKPTEPLPPPIVPTSTVFEDSTKSIRVTNMTSGQLLLNGFEVEGTAVAFESQFSWKLEDAKGTLVAQGIAKSRQPDMGVPGPFEIPVLFGQVPVTATGTLVLYEASAKDGSPIHVVRIPVTFSDKTQTVNVYFGNSKKNPNAMDCSLVYPVERIMPEGAVDSGAVLALLEGPTDAEKKAGYYTTVPTGVVLQGVDYKSMMPTVTLDFNQALQEQVGGSCRVAAIRSQIAMTASQGVGTEGIIISIDGRTEDILQP